VPAPLRLLRRRYGVPVVLEDLKAVNVEQANKDPVAGATGKGPVDLGDDPVEQAGVEVLGHGIAADYV